MPKAKVKSASPSGKPPTEIRCSSSLTSETDWTRVQAMKDEDIVITEEHPELDLQHIVRVIARRSKA